MLTFREILFAFPYLPNIVNNVFVILMLLCYVVFSYYVLSVFLFIPVFICLPFLYSPVLACNLSPLYMLCLPAVNVSIRTVLGV
jgi:hypothetical protein